MVLIGVHLDRGAVIKHEEEVVYLLPRIPLEVLEGEGPKIIRDHDIFAGKAGFLFDLPEGRLGKLFAILDVAFREDPMTVMSTDQRYPVNVPGAA